MAKINFFFLIFVKILSKGRVPVELPMNLFFIGLK